MSDIHVIERELRRQYPGPSATATARARAVVIESATECSRPALTVPRRRWRGVLLVAVALLALAGTSVAIANGLGAFSGVFNGIGSANHPRTAADVIDPASRAYLERSANWMRLDTSRRIAQLPGGRNLYVLKTTWKGLCDVVAPTSGSDYNCSRPLSRSHPSTVWFNASSPDSSDWFLFGIALDGVTAVSFEPNGQEVTLPVRDNVWMYRGDSFEAMTALIGLPLTAHFADGRTVVDKCADTMSRREYRRLGVRLGIPKSEIKQTEGSCGP